MKLSINKLIANDIINYGMDQTESFNYTVSLNAYLEDYTEEDKKYILDNIDDIVEDIGANERVADFELIEKDGDKDFDMVFYWGYLLDPFENMIFEKSKELDNELDFEDIVSVSSEILNGDKFNEILTNKIKNYDNGREID